MAEGSSVGDLTRQAFQLKWDQRIRSAGWYILPVPAAVLAYGLWQRQPGVALVMVGAAVTVGFGAFHQLGRSRLVPMVVAATGFALSAWVGAVLARQSVASGVAVTASWGLAFGAATALGNGAWWVGLQCVIAMFVSAAYPTGVWPATERVMLVLLAAVLQIGVTCLIWLLRHESFFWGERENFEPFSWNLQPTRFGFRFPLDDAGLRYTLRVAAVLTVSTFITRHLWHHLNGYWIPMTSAIVLKTDFHTTYTRGVARLAGTLVGATAVTLLTALLRPSPPVLALLLLGCLWICFTHQRVNYGLFAVFITGYVVLLLALGGLPEPGTALRRTIATVIGGAIPLISFAVVPPGKPRVPAVVMEAAPVARPAR